ncbi:Carboxy-S-adenosyl-L-methionine synthase [Thalassocella blandensis]|nr:Carboxy-S-adenosyl-L-methionine synthase [Thalassocella blandensis]
MNENTPNHTADNSSDSQSQRDKPAGQASTHSANEEHTSKMKDTIYATPLEATLGFAFDQKVVDVFPDMIKRSVPGYTTIVHMIGQMAQRYAQADTRCYDLGCSLGASTLSMRHRIQSAGSSIIAVDNSPEMIERCRQVIEADSSEIPVELVQGDILDVDIQRASVCVLNFTLQFVAKEQRPALLKKIFDGMVSGGILIISEKLCFDDNDHQELMTELHHYFKKTNGYSDLEISQKRNALENVLIPETFDAHKQRLLDIGFHSPELWFQCFNFSSFIAFKK